MTTEEFYKSLDALGQSFLSKPSNTLTKFEFHNAVTQLVLELYETGGYILDNLQVPIMTFEEVDVIIGMNEHSLLAITVRKS